MGSLADKLQKLAETKSAIKAALQNKGLTATNQFSTYADLIASLPVAGVDVVDLSKFKYNPTGTILTSTTGQDAITELSNIIPIICESELDSSYNRLVISKPRVTLRDNLILICRTNLTLNTEIDIVYNGDVKPLYNSLGERNITVQKGCILVMSYNESTGRWYKA